MDQRIPPIDISKIRIRPPKIPFRSIVSIIFLAFMFLVAWNLWFTVEPEEVGVVLRFGKFVRESKPGLHFKLPDPVESVVKVPVQRQLKEEFGFRTAPRFESRERYTDASLKVESIMLTGDLNVVVVEWSSQFRITDPYKYLFKIKVPHKQKNSQGEFV
jgi:membrane protease subunit HflK